MDHAKASAHDPGAKAKAPKPPPSPGPQQAPAPGRQWRALVQLSAAAGCGDAVYRKCKGCGSALADDDAPIMRQCRACSESDAATAPPDPPSLPRGGGTPLAPPLRHELEGLFAADLSGVRIHQGGTADAAATRLDALAFTQGQDVSFASGRFAPETRDGRRLLAHELTHTIQQRGGGAAGARGFRVSGPQDPEEREADRVAERVVEGKPATPIAPAAAAPMPVIARQPATPAAPSAVVTQAADAIVADLRGVTTRWASARIVSQFNRDASTVRAILDELKGRGPANDTDGPGMIRWLFGDLTAEDASILRRRLIQLHAADDLAAMAAEEIKSRLEGYTSEDDSHIILQILGEYTHGGAELDGVLAELERQTHLNETATADWLLGDLDRVSSWRLVQHFYQTGATRAVRYATRWTVERVYDLIAGFTSYADSQSIYDDLEMVPAEHRPYVMSQLDARCRAARHQSVEDVLIHDMDRQPYQRLRGLAGIRLRPNDAPISAGEVAVALFDATATVAQWVVCGIVGIFTGLVSVIVDLAGMVRDIVLGVWNLIWSLIYLISGGSAGSENWLRVKQFFIGIGRLFTDPGAVFTALWDELALEFNTIQGPFTECRRAEFVVRKFINALVNILLIFLMGYGAAKAAVSGIRALTEFVALAREVGFVEASAQVASRLGRAVGRFATVSVTRAGELLRALSRPLSTLRRVRAGITAVLLAAEDQGYWAYLRRRGGMLAEREQQFWRDNRRYWTERAQRQQARHAEVTATADELGGALDHQQAPEDADAIIQGTTQDADGLDQSVEALHDEVAPEARADEPAATTGPATTDPTTTRPATTGPATGTTPAEPAPPVRDPAAATGEGDRPPPTERGRPGRAAETDAPVRAEAETPDRRHEVEVLEDGTVLRCSDFCLRVRRIYERLLGERSDLEAWLRRIEALGAGSDAEAARAATLAAAGEERLRTIEELRGLSNSDLAARAAGPAPAWLSDEIAYEIARRQAPGLTYADFMNQRIQAEPLTTAPSEADKPAYNLPGDLEFRYRRYVYNYRRGGRPAAQMLSFEEYRTGHFETSAVPDARPGRGGGVLQSGAKDAIVAEGTGFRRVENVPLDGHFPDLVRDNPAGGRDFLEVGRLLENGLPEEREAAKLAEEIPALGPNDTVTFVDSADINNRITYRPGEDPSVVRTRRLPGRRLGGVVPGEATRNGAGGFDYVETGDLLQNGLPSSTMRERLARELAELGPNDTLMFVDRTDGNNVIRYQPGEPASVVGERAIPGRSLGGVVPSEVTPNAGGGFDFVERSEILQSGAPATANRARLARELAALGPHDALIIVDPRDPTRRILLQAGAQPAWLPSGGAP